MRGANLALAFTCAVLAACGSTPTNGGTSSGGSGGGSNSGGAGASSSLTAAELAALAGIALSPLPKPAADASNRFADDARAAAFGQKLFFETAFAGKLLDGDNDGSSNALGKKGDTGKVACAGCHVPKAGFLDDRTLGQQISLGAGWGRRRAPSLLDVGQATLLMWDGRHDTLYNQPFGPIESAVEMNSSRLYVAEQIYQLHRSDYEAIFGAMPPLDDATRFPKLNAEQTGCQPSTVDPPLECNGTKHGMPGDGAEFDGLSSADQDVVTRVIVNMGKALGAYERLLDCGPSRFDQWARGQSDALSPSEQRGAAIFVGRGKCVGCHSGPFLSDQKFHNVGLKAAVVAVVFTDQGDTGAVAGLAAALTDPLNGKGKFSDGDDGRLPSSIDPALTGAFRTPTLRCSARRPSFMHTGQFKTLDDVVAFFTRGGDPFGYPGTNELEKLDLDQQDEQDLVAFLAALEGPGPSAALVSPP